jgi:Sorting nexin 8/Mvp1 BAR domain
MFLTVPTELAVWRKQATISVQDEFQGKPLPPNLEDSLPPNLQELFDQVRQGVKRSADIYINLCNQVERLAKRKEGLAAEYQRCSTALMQLTEVTVDTYAADVSDIPPLNAGLSGTARHLSNAVALLNDESKGWDEGVLEDLKKQRDALVSMRDTFDRRDRLDKDEIPKLERRIKNNEEKLRNLRARPEGVGKPGDVEKVEEAIFRVRIPSVIRCWLDNFVVFVLTLRTRTRKPSSQHTLARSSSRNASKTKSSSSSRRSTLSAGCTRTGRTSGSSTPSCSRRTGGLPLRRLMECPRAIS